MNRHCRGARPHSGRLLSLLLLILVPFAFSSCSNDDQEITRKLVRDYGSDVATTWFDVAYNRVKADALPPTVASRLYGFVGVTLYESLVGGMPGYQSLEGQLNGFDAGTLPTVEATKEYHWPTVANSALAAVMHDLFAAAASDAVIDATGHGFESQFTEDATPEVLARSKAYGEAVAAAIIAWKNTDGFTTYNNCTTYTIPVGPQYWVPTPGGAATPHQPCWGEIRMFVGTPVPSPGTPPVWETDPSSACYLKALDVYNTVNAANTTYQAIARFWADNPTTTGTPPGHSISICRQIIEQEDMKLDVAALAFARVGMAVHDAFISCWKTKYTYWWLRPVTYIRNVIGADIPAATTWDAYIAPTPSFPEYTSGHSTEAGAAAQVMTDLWGDIPFTDHTHDAIGLAPRSFSTFFQAAEEAVISRKYGGIHYDYGNHDGYEQGKTVGQHVSALAFRRPQASGVY